MMTADNAAAWAAWCAFTDAAQVAPDTLMSYSDLAARYERYTRKSIAVEEVARLAHAVGAPDDEPCSRCDPKPRQVLTLDGVLIDLVQPPFTEPLDDEDAR